jgi:hypothetical protein
MNDASHATEEFTRFFKITPAGRWQRKSPLGAYEEMKNKSALKRLQVISAKSAKRIE